MTLRATRAAAAPMLLALLAGCGGPAERTTTPPPPPPTKESLYAEGHRLFLTRQFDSAEVRLLGAIRLDSTYTDAWSDLAGLHYDRGMQHPEGSSARTGELRKSYSVLGRLERTGRDDAETYERLCELAVALGDDKGFLRYARKNAERYPYDRQYYNLGIASYGAEDWQGCIRTQKAAIQKFPESVYVGGYHRYLGRAYMKVDRDQSAERTFTEGLAAVDARLSALRRTGADRDSPDVRRLVDDKVAMLQSLRKLHQTYGAHEKRKAVEAQLKALGQAP